MDKTPEPQAVFRKGPDRADVKKVEGIVNHFATEVKSTAKAFINEFGPIPDKPTTEDLLRFRKELVTAVKSGMLERLDMEEKIGMLAAVIWFMRLEETRQTRIMEEWG